MNDLFPKGETKVFLPDERIMFEIGITTDGDIDFIVRLGDDTIVLQTTPTGAGNIGAMLHNASVRAMAVAIGDGDNPYAQ